MTSDLQDQIISNIAAQMSKDIDNQVLMSGMDWHKLEIGEGRSHGY